MSSLTSLQTESLNRLPICRTSDLPICLLPNCRLADLPACRNPSRAPRPSSRSQKLGSAEASLSHLLFGELKANGAKMFLPRSHHCVQGGI